MKLAIRAYATGSVKTVSEAAQMFGLNPMSVYQAKRSLDGQELMEQVDNDVGKRSVDVSALIASLGEKAVNRIGMLMQHAESEAVQLAAAKDLLDRNPVTSKTQRVQAEGFTLGDGEAKHLAAALMQAVEIRNRVGEAAKLDVMAIAEVVSISSGEVK